MDTKQVEHTPGPWKVHNTDWAFYIEGPDERPICLLSYDTVSMIPSCIRNRKEDKANAAFIVHACNSYAALLAALEAVHQSHHDICFCLDTKGRGLGQCVWCDVRAAIALARGKE